MAPKILKDGTVLAFDETTQSIQVLRQASVLIEDDRITAIEESISDLPTPDGVEIIDVTGKIVSPGFVNTHVHTWQSVYRSIGPNVTLAQYFGWVSQYSETATTTFTPDDIYISSLEGYLEGLNAGVTSYVEHAHNNWGADVMTSGFDAARDSGARIWWCYDVVPRPDFSVDEQWSVLEKLVKQEDPRVLPGISLDGLAESILTVDGIQLDETMKKLKYSPYHPQII